MPDYIYLLGNRLSADQQGALRHLREAARQAEMLLFLTGDAVRDLTSGHAVRDIEVAVSGNALELKKILKDKAPDELLADGDILFVPTSGPKNALVTVESILPQAAGAAVYHAP